MENNIDRIIWLAVSVALFITALTWAANSYYDQQKKLNTIRYVNIQEDRRLFTSLEMNTIDDYSGAEIIQSIRQIKVLDADIQVGNQIFKKDLDIDQTDFSVINLDKRYTATYERDNQGTLKKIIFH